MAKLPSLSSATGAQDLAFLFIYLFVLSLHSHCVNANGIREGEA